MIGIIPLIFKHVNDGKTYKNILLKIENKTKIQYPK